MGIGIDVVQADPDAERAQSLAKIDEMAPPGAALPTALRVAQVEPVGAGVLRDHQDFLDPGADQALGLGQHLLDRPAGEVAAQRGDDAEAAAVVAALGNLQIGVVARRQLDAGRRQQIQEGVVRRRQHLVHRADHGLVLLRAGDGENAGMGLADALGLDAEAARDDHPPVLLQRLADRGQGLGLGAVQKTAGVDDHRIGVAVVARQAVALGTEARDDAL